MGRISNKDKAEFEQRITNAKRDLRTGKITDIRTAAIVHSLAYTTLQNRLKGAGTRQEARIEQQILTPFEELAIKKWIFRLDDWGFPPRHQYVKDMALDFLHSHGVQHPVLGKNWITWVLSRHHDLASKFSTRLDKQRAYANNPDILKDFYEKVGCYNLWPE